MDFLMAVLVYESTLMFGSVHINILLVLFAPARSQAMPRLQSGSSYHHDRWSKNDNYFTNKLKIHFQ